jgi:hypothetical protein
MNGLVRKNDPSTSVEAATNVDVGAAERRVLRALLDGAKTCWEITMLQPERAAIYGTITPRPKELEKRNLVQRIGNRKTPNGKGVPSNQILWALTPWGRVVTQGEET